MKYITLTTKALRALMLCWTISVVSVPALEAETPSIVQTENSSMIAAVHQRIDSVIDEFQEVFKNSFSDNSTEKFNVTAKKMGACRKAIEELISWLQEQLDELKTEGKEFSNEYRYINQFIQLCDDFFKRQIAPIHDTLTTNLKQKKKLAFILNSLKKKVDPIMSEANFQKVKGYLDALCSIATEEGQLEIAQTLETIWTEAQEVRKEYSKGVSQIGKFIARNQRRMPY